MDDVAHVSETRITKRGLRTTEKEVPVQSTNRTKSGTASGSRQQTLRPNEGIQAQSFKHIAHDTEESHTLNFIDPQEEDDSLDHQAEGT